MTPPSYNSPAGWYVWTHPGCPLRIHLNLEVIDRLRREILASKAKDCELGGLLIGAKRSGVTRIFEFVPLPVDQKEGEPRFTLSSQWLDEVIARCPSDAKVVGYYRTDMDQLIRLRPDDLALMQQRFRDPLNVCLVVAAAPGGQIDAGFFCWQDGSLPVNPHLTFPLSGTGLASSGYPIQTQESAQERVARFVSEIQASLLRGGEAKAVVRICMVVTTLVLLVALVAGRWESSNSPPSLGLQVNGDGTRFLLNWNRESQPVKSAKEASLLIWDSSRAASDGNSEPLHLPLTLAQLRTGEMTYTSFAPSERVHFRLDVTETSGYFKSEAVTSITPLEALKPTEPPAPEPRPARVRKPPAKNQPDTVRPALATVTPAAAAKTFAPQQPAETPRTPGRTIIQVPPPPPDAPAATAALSRAASAPELPAFAATVDTPPGNLNSRPPAPAAQPAALSVPGMVTITSEPSGAEVAINAAPAGLTPVTLQISPVGLGFTVTVTKPGYIKWSLQTFATDKPYSLHAQLKESPR